MTRSVRQRTQGGQCAPLQTAARRVSGRHLAQIQQVGLDSFGPQDLLRKCGLAPGLRNLTQAGSVVARGGAHVRQTRRRLAVADRQAPHLGGLGRAAGGRARRHFRHAWKRCQRACPFRRPSTRARPTRTSTVSRIPFSLTAEHQRPPRLAQQPDRGLVISLPLARPATAAIYRHSRDAVLMHGGNQARPAVPVGPGIAPTLLDLPDKGVRASPRLAAASPYFQRSEWDATFDLGVAVLLQAASPAKTQGRDARQSR